MSERHETPHGIHPPGRLVTSSPTNLMTTVDTPASPRLPLWKKILFSAILGIIVVGVLEAGSVVYLRIARGYDGEHLYQYVYDPYKNILPTPNYVDTRGIRHNANGFRRSEDVARTKPPGTYRVFLMGASTAYGIGGLWPHIQTDYAVLDNRETIDAYLERQLQADLPGVNVEVINAAITSTWTHHSLIYINQTILGYDPDMILFLDGFNDFYHTNTRHDQFGSYSYNLPSRVIMGEPSLYALAYVNGWWLFRRSALVHLIGRGLRVVKSVLKGRPQQTPVDVEHELAGLSQVFPHNALAMHRRIGLILRDEGVIPVFMLQPLLALERDKPMSDIERQLFEFNIESYRPNHEVFIHQARDTVSSYEHAMAKEIGAEFIDLTRIFRQEPGQIYTDYAHLTPEGNELLAEVVAEFILPIIRDGLTQTATH